MTNTLKGSRPANGRKAWNCGFCHSTNVTTLCGCAASKAEAGRTEIPEISVDDIELDLGR